MTEPNLFAIQYVFGHLIHESSSYNKGLQTVKTKKNLRFFSKFDQNAVK